MKKKLLGILFMVCLIFIFTPKSVMAYSYYCDVTGYISGVDLNDTSHTYYFAGKDTGYMYYFPDMSRFSDSSNTTSGVSFDNLKLKGYGSYDKGTLVLHPKGKESDGTTKYRAYGLKFQKKSSNYYIYLEYNSTKYYLNIVRSKGELEFSKSSKTEWRVKKEGNYTYSIIDNKEDDYFLTVDKDGLRLSGSKKMLYAFEVGDFSEIKYTIQDGKQTYTHSGNLPTPKDSSHTFYSYTNKPLSDLMSSLGLNYVEPIKGDEYMDHKVGEDPGFETYEKSAEKKIYANYYNKANIKSNWNIKPTNKDVVTYSQKDYDYSLKKITSESGKDVKFDVPEGGWITLEFPTVYDTGKYYKVTSIKANGDEIEFIKRDAGKTNNNVAYAQSYLFSTVNSDATYEITVEVSYPEVKGFYYNLYTKMGSFDTYSTTRTITNLGDGKVQLYTTTKELQDGLLRDPYVIIPIDRPTNYQDYEKYHSISYKYEYYMVKDGKTTKLDLEGDRVLVDLKDVFTNLADKKEVQFYTVVTKTRKEDGASKSMTTKKVTITCKYEGGDFSIDVRNVDTQKEIKSNQIFIMMKKTNEANEAAKCEIMREGDKDYTEIAKVNNSYPYIITQNGTYTIRLTDKFGNSETTTLIYKNIGNDVTAPKISGVENGKTYCLAQTITVTDENLKAVKVNGNIIKLNENNQYTLSGTGKQVIMAMDTCENITEITITINGRHTGGKATCKAKAVCDICKTEYGKLDVKNHAGKKKWIITSTTHEQRYSCCNAIAVKKSAHQWKAGKCTKCGTKLSVGKASITTKSSDGTTKISWKKVTNATGYKVYRATSKTGKYTLLKTTTALSYSDSSIVGGKNYYYKVVAYYKSGSTTISGKDSAVKLQVGTLKKVSLTVKNTKKSTASLSWKKVDGAKKYQVYRATSKNGKYSNIGTVKNLTYTDKSLSKNKTYYYKVRAYYVKDGKNVYGSYSGVKSVKITK